MKSIIICCCFFCSMWANAQRVTWATEAGYLQYKELGMENVGVHPLVLGISADYNVNNMFSMKSGLYYTLEDTRE